MLQTHGIKSTPINTGVDKLACLAGPVEEKELVGRKGKRASSQDNKMSATAFIHLAVLACCLIAVCHAKPNENLVAAKGSLVGITVTGETVLDIVKPS